MSSAFFIGKKLINSLDFMISRLSSVLLFSGIKLDISKIEKNPGRRQVAKLKANSLWGYFALNTNKTMFKIITDPSEWFQMLQNDQFVIHDVNMDNPDFIQVQYSEQKELHFGGLTTNVVPLSSQLKLD